jgi:hypothetical protein
MVADPQKKILKIVYTVAGPQKKILKSQYTVAL